MRTKKRTTDTSVLSSIHDGLVEHPELADRIHMILKLATEPELGGKIRTADEAEAILIEELRKLGNESLVGWAQGVDNQLGEDLKKGNADVQMREKKL